MPSPVIVRRRLKKEARDASAAAENAKIKEAEEEIVQTFEKAKKIKAEAEAKKLKAEAIVKEKPKAKVKATPKVKQTRKKKKIKKIKKTKTT